MARLTVASVQEYATQYGYRLEKYSKGGYTLNENLGYTGDNNSGFAFCNLNAVIKCINNGYLLNGESEAIASRKCIYPNCPQPCDVDCDNDSNIGYCIDEEEALSDDAVDFDFMNQEAKAFISETTIAIYQVITTSYPIEAYPVPLLEKCMKLESTEEIKAKVLEDVKPYLVDNNYNDTGFKVYQILRYHYNQRRDTTKWQQDNNLWECYSDLYRCSVRDNDHDSKHFWESCQKFLNYLKAQNQSAMPSVSDVTDISSR
jgi:hypothetical protein